MATKLEQRVYRLRQRKSDLIKGVRLGHRRLAEAKTFDSADEAADYISESMDPVDAEYTKLTYEECDRVEGQLKEACKTKCHDVVFRHQGSVTSETHIKFYSDIDLLMLTHRFHYCKAPVEPTSPYKGDAMADLKELRKVAEDRLATSFPAAKVDTSGGKSVAVSGGSLRRKIDVVIGAWLDTQKYRLSGSENDRGIEILDKGGPRVITNFPFLHNRQIQLKDVATGGRLRRLIRFLKSAKSDSDLEIKVSSYDIAALAYALPQEDFTRSTGSDVELAERFLLFSEKVRLDTQLQSGLYVPNETRLIYCDEGAKADQVKVLNEEIAAIIVQAKAARSSRQFSL
jgi:hypothetical protein